MAREVIYGDNGRDVIVAWGKDEELVQVTSVVTDAIDRNFKMINDALRELELPEINVDEFQRRAREKYGIDGDGRYSPFADGWTSTISHRRALNALIAVLKRARNNSFGADE